MSHVNPTREQFKAIFGLPLEAPVMMLNLLRFRDRAAYAEDDPERGEPAMSGAEAYRRYSDEATPVFEGLGGSQVWIGRAQTMVIGPDDEDWDLAFVARYPSARAFVEMLRDPDYQRAVRHRNAAVADSRLIRCSEEKPGRTYQPG